MSKNIDIEEAKKSCSDYYDKVHIEYSDKFSDELAKKPYDKDFLNRFLSILRDNGSLLDVGCCSTAQQARYFYKKGYEVTCIDLSENCINTAMEKYPYIDFRQMDMTEMDFEDNSFDGINASYSIIHIPNEKLDSLFITFNKLLKINGSLAIAVHAGDFYGYYDEDEVPVFYRTYTQSELKQYLEKYGFEIIEMNQRQPIYDFEFQSERIYLVAKKIRTIR